MERTVGLGIVGEYGIPYDDIVKEIETHFVVGSSYRLDRQDQIVANGTLRRAIAEGFSVPNKTDIKFLFCIQSFPDILKILDDHIGTKIDFKVMYCSANLYWRFRMAISWGVSMEDFGSYEKFGVYQDILKARADMVLDFDKVIHPNNSLQLLDLRETLFKTLAKVNIHSSRVRCK